MLRRNERVLDNIPVGALGIIALDGCQEMGKRVNDYIVNWRREDSHEFKNDVVFKGYERDNYLIDAKVPRFGSGEAKGIIETGYEFGISEEEILARLQKKLNISLAEAQEYVKKFGRKNEEK